MSKHIKKIQDEHQRTFTSSIDETAVILNKKPQPSSQAYKDYQKHVSQQGPKVPVEDGGIIERPQSNLCFRTELQQARLAKNNMKQADLAKMLNMKPSVINEWESGKGVPNGQQKAQLGKVLGVRFSKPPKVHPTNINTPSTPC